MAKPAIVSLCAVLLLTGCDSLIDEYSGQNANEVSYSECLRGGVAGGGTLSAEDIRSLCAEAANVVGPTYDWADGELVPGNEFTRCYEKVHEELKEKQTPDANRLAKLSCRYPEVE